MKIKVMKIFIHLLLLLLGFGTSAQNIIPNSSFEISKKKPRFMSSTGRDFESAIYKWTVPNEASTDLISPRFDSKNLTEIPPRTGEQMIGIVVNGDYWAEYGKVKLLKSLEVGTEYYVEYWISMPTYYSKNKPVPTNLNDHFGLYFSKDIYNGDKRILTAKPQVGATRNEVARPVKWTKITGKFIAEKAATHMYLGQFLDESDPGKIAKGYFFIDDVFVEAFTNSAVDYTPSRYYSINGSTASVNIDNIYFETDKYELLASSYDELDNLVKILTKNPTLKIEIQGHTDDVGSAEHNKELSYNRAKTVYDYINNSGIGAERLDFEGYGITKSIASNASETGRQKNRRVDFVVEADPELEDSREMMAPEYIYKFSSQIAADKKARHSFIGRYVNKWNCDGRSDEKPKTVDLNQLKNSRPVSARKHINKLLKTEKALFFNEYPDHPQNRAFVSSMLDDLFAAGFTYFFMEDIVASDKELNNRAYPVINTGYYVKDPVYGDMIRQAMQKGFEVVSYEPTKMQIQKAVAIVKRTAKFSDPALLQQCAKDWARAMNINRIYKKDPSAKIVVLTSRGNIKEVSSNGFKTMASWYQTFTKINPLTIDQRTFTEKCKADEDPLYGTRTVKEPTVFFYKNNLFIKQEENTITKTTGKFVDLQIYFPRSSFRNDRPTWLEMNGYRMHQQINPDKYGMGTPCMVMAFRKEEDMTFAVPMDAVELGNTGTRTSLLLPTGHYTLLLNDGVKAKQVDWVVE